MAGLEYGNGAADAVSNLPRLGLNGLEASLGYRISDSIAVSAAGSIKAIRVARACSSMARPIEDGCDLPALNARTLQRNNPIPAMPLKAGASSAALRAVMPPSA
jgi:hypothetical protein